MKFNILKKVNGSGSTAPKNKFAYLAHIDDIRSFPQADYKGVALTDDILMKEKTGMSQIYITPAAQEYTYDTAGDSDSKSFKLKFMGTHPGTELEALEFAKNYLEEGFVVLIPSCEIGLKVLGTPDAPLVFTSSHKSDKDSQKFIFTFEQEIGTENVYQLYTGLITLNENIDVDMGDFLEYLKDYLKLDGSNLSEAQKQNLRTILGSDGKNIGNNDLSLNENRSLNLGSYFLNFFSNLGAKVGINKNNPTQALEVVGNIKTDGIIIAEGGTPDEEGAIKRTANEIKFKTSSGWETVMLKGDYVSDTHGIVSPDTLAPVGGWKTGWYEPKVSSLTPGTNYPNQNNLKSKDGFFTRFYYNGVSWESLERIMPQATQFIPSFADSVFPLVSTTANPIQRTHQNVIWLLTPGQTALVTDVPGVSSKWVALGNNKSTLESFSNSQDITPATLISGGLNSVGQNVGTSAKNTGKIPINSKDKLFVKNTFTAASIVSLFYNAANQIIGQFPNTGGVELEIEVPKEATHVVVSGSELLTVRRKSYIDDVTSGAVSLLVDAGFKEEVRTGTIYAAGGGFTAMKVNLYSTDEVVLLTLGWGGGYAQTNYDFYTSSDVLISSGKVPNGQLYKDFRIYPPTNAAYVILKAYGGGVQNTVPEFYLKIMSNNLYNLIYAPKSVKSDVEAQRYFDLGSDRKDLSARNANNTYGIMLMGQSNATAVGDGTTVADLATYGLPASQNVRQYNGTANGIYPMQIINAQRWGIEWPLLKKLTDYKPATAFNYLHKALGGTSLVAEWMPEQFHNVALGGQAADMVSNWKLIAPTVNMKCVIWIQGEHDGATAASYYQKLKDLIAFLRGASGNANLRFVCMGVHKDSLLYFPAVRGAQTQLVGEDPYYYFVNPDDIPMTSGDNIHYNGAMLNLLAEKIFQVIKNF